MTRASRATVATRRTSDIGVLREIRLERGVRGFEGVRAHDARGCDLGPGDPPRALGSEHPVGPAGCDFVALEAEFLDREAVRYTQPGAAVRLDIVLLTGDTDRRAADLN